MTSTATEARIYVGTYAKYNNGSIAGAWLTLSDYSSADEFYTACKELHSDEADPEYMFQDFEGFPRSLYSESGGIEEVYEALPVLEKLADYGTEEWLSLHNTRASEDGTSEHIYENDEEFLNEHFSTPNEAVRAALYGKYNYMDAYVRFDGYGNLESIPDYAIERELNTEELTEWAIANPQLLD